MKVDQYKKDVTLRERGVKGRELLGSEARSSEYRKNRYNRRIYTHNTVTQGGFVLAEALEVESARRVSSDVEGVEALC